MIFYMPIGAIDMSIGGWSQVSVAGRAHDHGYIWSVGNLERENLSCCGKCCVRKTIINRIIIESQIAWMKIRRRFRILGPEARAWRAGN